MFYYEQFFRTALDGIDRSNIMPISIQIGQVILLISFLVAVYESFIRGGERDADLLQQSQLSGEPK